MTGRVIRTDREEARLLRIALDRGYDSIESMLRDMYMEQGLSLHDLQESLFMSVWALRRRLHRMGVSLRSRGGPNNMLVAITRELVEEALRDGIVAVAERQGVTVHVLSQRMKKWCEENAPELLL